MKQLLLVALLLMSTSLSFAQQSMKELAAMPKDEEGRYPFWRCATVEVNNALKAQNPQLPSVEEFEQFMQKATTHRKQFKVQLLEDQVYYIPVVVHVIHNGEAIGQGTNISYAQIQSQIEVLNEDFRRKEGSRGFNDHPAGADSKIEFILAEIDPDGNFLAEPGVHRVRDIDVGVSGPLSPYSMDDIVKPATYWDPNRYLNMWTANLGGGLLGYAQFPISSGLDGLDLPGLETAAETDGVVMKYNTFGSSDKGNFNLQAPYDKGRVATHEVGHWLGLRHIWGDGGCDVDDFCQDTPISDGPNFGCSTPQFSCGSEDMTQNYMDYSTDPCMSIFTLNQKERFLTVLEFSPRRRELLTSNVLARAEFAANKTTVYEGQKVNFSDLSVGEMNSWQWAFQGGTPATSIAQNPEVTYSTPGTYSVSLTVNDNTASYEEIKEDYITVLEPASAPVADFTAEQTFVLTAQNVQFRDASSESAFSWNWVFEGGEPATSTLQHPVVQFNSVGSFGVSLRVVNAKGEDEKSVNGFINVALGPQLTISPDEISEQLHVEEVKTGILSFNNPGDQILTYSITSTFENGVFTFPNGQATGSVDPGASTEVGYTLSTGSLYGGLYHGKIEVATNDPRNEVMEIPVVLEITGVPAVELSATEVGFGNVLVRSINYDSIFIHNTGTDTLRFSPQINSDVFSLQEAEAAYVLAADSVVALKIAFNPLSLGTHSGSLLLNTNVPGSELVTVGLTGEAVPAAEIALNPSSLNVSLMAGDSANEVLSIRNAGGADLIFSIELQNRVSNELLKAGAGNYASYEERDTTECDHLINANTEEATVLVIQNTNAWGVDVQSHVLTPMGIVSDKIHSSSIGSTDFSPYKLIITVSEESYGYYDAISNAVDKFEAFARAGGSILYQTVSFGRQVNLAGGVLAVPGEWELNNEVVNADHPVVLDLPATLYDEYISQNNMEFLPANADIITKGSVEGKPTTVEYTLERGRIIATGMNWEWGLTRGNEYGIILSRSVEHLLDNSVSWLSTEIFSGTISSGEVMDIPLKLNAKYLMGGNYHADVHISSNDPANEVVTFPVSLEVTGVPEITLSETEIDFGTQWTGGDTIKILTIQNSGTDDLVVTPAIANGVFSVDPTTITIPAKDSYPLEVSFTSANNGTFTSILELNTNDAQNNQIEVGLSAVAVGPPVLELNPASFSVHLNSGEVRTENLHIENTGGDTLFYSLDARALSTALQKEELNSPEVVLLKGEADTRKGSPLTARSGDDGVDGFGYSWVDSKSAIGPVFNWIEIAGTGTSIYLGDDGAQQVNLPFPFSFYGEEKNTVNIGANGILSFNGEGSTSFSNTALPNSYHPNNLIAAFWTDLYPGGNVTYYGTAEYFIVQFTDVPRYGSSTERVTFQFILYPNGNIKLQYKESTLSSNAGTIGIENATGTEGMQIAFNTAFVENQLAVLITAEKVIDFAPAFGMLLPGASADVQVTFNAEGLFGGVYEKEILLSTNDPVREETIIPVTLQVTGVPAIELSENALNFDPNLFVGQTDQQKLLISNSGTMDLLINSLSVSADVFTVNATADTILPGESIEVLVDFSSAVAGHFNDTLVIESNDPDNARIEVPLVADAFEAPVIVVSTEAITRSLEIGGSANDLAVRIRNNGGAALQLDLSFADNGFAEGSKISSTRKVDFYADTTIRSFSAPYELKTEGTFAVADESPIEETFNYFVEGSTGMSWINGELYVLQFWSGDVYKYNPQTQEAVYQFNVPSESYGMTWDGEYLWVTNNHTAYAYSLSGSAAGSFLLPSSSGYHRSIAWDGSAYIVTTPFENEPVHRVNERGDILSTWSLPEGGRIDQLVADGSRFWVLDLNAYALVTLSVSQDQLQIVETFDYPFPDWSYSLALDGQRRLWAADWYKLYRLNLTSQNMPQWIVAEVPNTTVEVAAGQEYTINLSFQALEGMRVGNHAGELHIRSNDPVQPLSSVLLEMEILNSAPAALASVDDVVLEIPGNDYQLELVNMFSDANVEDQLRYFARAENDVVEVAMGGSMLNIHPVRGGQCTIRVFATDQRGAKSEEISFVVTVIDKTNNPPNVTLNVPLINLIQKGQSSNLPLTSLFADLDGDVLSFEVISDNSSVLLAESSENSLVLRGIEKGTASVLVIASDNRGGTAELSFHVSVNAPPQLLTEIPHQTLIVNSDAQYFQLNDLFSDADGDLLNYEALSGDQNMVNLSIEDGELIMLAQKKGETIITITARDDKEGSVKASISVLVHHAPEVKKPLEDQKVGLSQLSSLNLYPYFQELDGEAMSFTISYDEKALKASVEGSLLELEGLKVGETTLIIEVKDTRGAKLTTKLNVNVVKVLSVSNEVTERLKVYPNPFSDKLQVESDHQGSITIMIYDQLSRLMKKEHWAATGEQKYTMDMAALAPGSYILQIVTADGTSIHKIVKH